MNKIELNTLIQKRCHKVPLDTTIKELINPTGIVVEEYLRIIKEIKEYGGNDDIRTSK